MVQPQLTHTVGMDGGTVRVALRGELDVAVTADVAAWMEAAMEQNPGGDVVLDLSGLDFLDSSGIREILNAYSSVTGRGGSFRVTGAGGSVREVLEIVAVYDLLT